MAFGGSMVTLTSATTPLLSWQTAYTLRGIQMFFNLWFIKTYHVITQEILIT